MKPLVISQLSWFWPLVVNFHGFGFLWQNSKINELSLNCTWELISTKSCKFPHLVQSSTLHQAGGPSPIKQAGPCPLKSQRKSRRAWEMSYVIHRYLDTWSIYDAILEVKISFTICVCDSRCLFSYRQYPTIYRIVHCPLPSDSSHCHCSSIVLFHHPSYLEST